MFKLNNVAGTIMYQDIPIVEFKFDRDKLVYSKLLCNNEKILPFEFRKLNANDKEIRNFFYYRIVPDTRIGIEESLKEAGIPYYDPELIIRYQNGRTFDDEYWLDCK